MNRSNDTSATVDFDLGAPPPAAAPQPSGHSGSELLRAATEVDVLLLLEGTFPYVSGGVSSWVNQIIRGFPDVVFGAIFLGSRRSDYKEIKYTLPENLAHLACHFLHEPQESPEQPATRPGSRNAFEHSEELHEQFRRARAGGPSGPLARQLQALLPMMRGEGPLALREFLHSEASWQRITAEYTQRCSDPSFVDYFWTVRIMHAPLWQLLSIADAAPRARVLHTVSTGYAGMLGALLAQAHERPLLLSEHGIYTKERKIDLFQAQWIRDNRGVFERRGGQVAYFKDLWVRFFEGLGRCCYGSSRHIVSLYDANRRRQIIDGAPPERTQCIPNGVDVARFAPLRPAPDRAPPPVACLVGRVVPIKDIKTFIRAMRSVVDRLPQAQGWIAGPEDEDPVYAEECRQLVESLGLVEHVRFLGYQQMTELLPRVGVMVLSSISEALPLVILEGFAAGVPCVSTDVGSCHQLIHGHGEADEALGSAGAVVQIADPQALGDAIVPLLADSARWHAASRAGVARVEQLYTQKLMFDRYRALYTESGVAGAAAASSSNGGPHHAG
jgi:glycosyltransferase involved in cell wall biosynthesis